MLFFGLTLHSSFLNLKRYLLSSPLFALLIIVESYTLVPTNFFFIAAMLWVLIQFPFKLVIVVAFVDVVVAHYAHDPYSR